MSYCRWSDECYTCDVYVYYTDDGYVIHVAGNRYVSDKQKPEYVESGDVNSHKLIEYLRKCDAWAKKARLEPIDLAEHGKTFLFDTPRECAEKLKHLRSIGYCVPEYAIATLLLEAKENEKNEQIPQ